MYDLKYDLLYICATITILKEFKIWNKPIFKLAKYVTNTKLAPKIIKFLISISIISSIFFSINYL